MGFRVKLLHLTALSALGSTVALGTAIAGEVLPTSRLGASISDNLAERDRAAAEEKRRTRLQQQAIQAAEARLREQLAAANPQPLSGGAAGVASDPPDESINNLARIFQAMKPAKAAVVMEKLSIDMQVRISRQIRERSMGLIMGAMSPDGAAMLSAAFANNGKLPPGLGNATIAPPALQSSNSARADPRISPMSASPGPLVPAVKLN
jgi:flagellar motility protein MotE (MotC chaperone)